MNDIMNKKTMKRRESEYFEGRPEFPVELAPGIFVMDAEPDERQARE
jgi:hypothetical protein